MLICSKKTLEQLLKHVSNTSKKLLCILAGCGFNHLVIFFLGIKLEVEYSTLL